MKRFKLLLLLCLLFICTGSFAGNPKYMHLSVVYKGGSTTLFVIDEAGAIQESKLKSIAGFASVSPDKIVNIQKEIQDKLNEFAAQGWKVVSVNDISNPGFAVTNYLLAKE